jgi:hypothetical protein
VLSELGIPFVRNLDPFEHCPEESKLFFPLNISVIQLSEREQEPVWRRDMHPVRSTQP